MVLLTKLSASCRCDPKKSHVAFYFDNLDATVGDGAMVASECHLHHKMLMPMLVALYDQDGHAAPHFYPLYIKNVMMPFMMP